jgi:hypothetical protein
MKEIVESNDNIERIFELLDFQNDKMFGYLSPGDIY